MLIDKRGDGLRGDGFAAADSIHAFVRLGLQIDALRLNAQGAGQGLAHGREVRAEFGLFGDDINSSFPD